MKKLLLITCFSVFCVHFGYSQTDKTSKDYGKIFVDAVNSDSEEKQKELINETFSPSAINKTGMDRLVGSFKRMHEMFAPLTYHHSEVNEFKRATGTVYVMHIYAKKQGAVMWTDFQLYLDTEVPHQLASIAFVAEVSEPVNLPNGSIDTEHTLEWFNKYVEKLQSENDLYGSILITKGNTTLLEKYFGYADLEKKRKISESTLFNIASGGKMFTALAIAQLVEAGKLKYEDKITQYLDGFPDKEKASKITIHHLLSHTSGVKEYWTQQTNKDVYTATNTNDHLKIVYKAGFEFEPGTAYGYCNSNFILLGGIIEIVSGQLFYDYIQQNILNKAGMKSTGYFTYASPGTAIPMARGGNDKTWIEAPHGIKGSSAGGAYSNARDILKFADALKNNTLVSAKIFTNMIAIKNGGLKVAEDYGYGFIIIKHGPYQKSYGHGGTAGGVNFELRYFPAQDITLIVFCNQNNGAYDDLKRNSIKLISGER